MNERKRIEAKETDFKTALELLKDSKRHKKIVNVDKLLHNYCKLRVSKDAVSEITSRINDRLYDFSPELDRIASNHGRKTIKEEDVIELFSFIDYYVL